MMTAIRKQRLRIVQLLSSYLAKRTEDAGPNRTSITAEEYTDTFRSPDIREWLVESRQWSTPLHHLTVIDAGRARALLRDGADLHARTDALEAPNPLSLARSLRAAGNAPPGSPADLVLKAAMPWSPRTHALFPSAVRARAVELLLVGRALAREPRFGPTVETVMIELWDDAVMPAALTRAGAV